MRETEFQHCKTVSLHFGSPQIANFRKRKRSIVNEQLLGEILRLYIYEKLSMRDIADMLSVSHMTVYRALNDSELEVRI